MTGSDQATFLHRLAACVGDGSLLRLTLGKPRGGEPDLRNVHIRPVALKAGPHLSFVWRYERRDVTKNLPPVEAVAEIGRLVGAVFHSAHLFTPTETLQLEFNKKGEPRLTRGQPVAGAPAAAGHDRAKSRLLPESSAAWLQALGVLNPRGVVREGMADKHRQIHKFVEILSHLVTAAPLPADRPVEIVDMGCGKGYLTFAVHDYFNRVLHREANVRGVELRPELVAACNRIAGECGADRLQFAAGSIEAASADADVLIALHACDTATDDALARGVAAGAALIVVAPCCQKELRPQLHAAPVLAPALRHGIFQERHAEFATDALRSLLLEWAGYETKVFEFISTEHTAKNTMIAAMRSAAPARTAAAAAPVHALAEFYGVTGQSLARQLGFVLRP